MSCVSNMFGVLLSVILLSTVTDVQSRYVRHPEINRSVVHKKAIATWDEAKRRCVAEGAILASPLDEGMLEYMRSSIGINDHTTPYFIGIRATGNPELIFASVEGVILDDLPEAAINMIDQLDSQDGDCLGMDRRIIRVVSCSSRLPYICYKNDTSAFPVNVAPETEPEETTAMDKYSSSGYTFMSGSYYKLHKEPAPWDKAQKICSIEGGYLAVINDANEAQAVSELISEKFSNGWAWIHIGLHRHEENGNWQSVLGDPLSQIHHKWAINFPVFHCGGLDSRSYINSVHCLWHLPYICEKNDSHYN